MRGRRKSGDAAAGHLAAAILAGELLRRYAGGQRNSIDASDGVASELNAILAPYSDFSVISNFSYDFDDPLKYRNPKAECFLILAHWQAIRPHDKDIPSAMKALSFAEEKTDGLDKCLTRLLQFEAFF
ncbi:MAG: hypothetical protein GXP32_07200 [Kiritimatiellaeota bacterium]|nr:hypothetical protein [Kiritimatiellota bacterium]